LLFEDGATLEVEADVRGGWAFLGGKVRGKENEENEEAAHGGGGTLLAERWGAEKRRRRSGEWRVGASRGAMTGTLGG
jgi:hypothetical protein